MKEAELDEDMSQDRLSMPEKPSIQHPPNYPETTRASQTPAVDHVLLYNAEFNNLREEMWEDKRETNLRRLLENPEMAECGELPTSHSLQVNCLNLDTPINPQTRTRLLRVKPMEMQRRKTLFDLDTQAHRR